MAAVSGTGRATVAPERRMLDPEGPGVQKSVPSKSGVASVAAVMETGAAVPLKTRMLTMRSPMFSLMALRLTVMPPSGEGEAEGEGEAAGTERPDSASVSGGADGSSGGADSGEVAEDVLGICEAALPSGSGVCSAVHPVVGMARQLAISKQLARHRSFCREPDPKALGRLLPRGGMHGL